jgi:hypothetical protein
MAEGHHVPDAFTQADMASEPAAGIRVPGNL